MHIVSVSGVLDGIKKCYCVFYRGHKCPIGTRYATNLNKFEKNKIESTNPRSNPGLSAVLSKITFKVEA